MRREFVRGYIACLLADGVFDDDQTPIVVATRAVADFTKDVGAVTAEMMGKLVSDNGNKIVDAVIGSARDFAEDFVGRIQRLGLKGAWAEMQEQYRRGMDAKAQRR